MAAKPNLASMVSAKHFSLDATVIKSAMEQNKFKTPYLIEHFSQRRGLVASQVHQTVASKDGRIWFVTAVGLGCYDGISIDIFGLGDELTNHGLRTIAVDDDNYLWLGSDSGIEVMDISEAKPKSLSFDEIGTVNCLHARGQKVVFGGIEGLHQKQVGEPIKRFADPIVSKAYIHSVLICENGDVWIIGLHIDLCIICPDGTVRGEISLPNEIGVPVLLAPGSDDFVLIGGDLGFAILDRNAELVFAVKTENPITALCLIDQHIWVGSNKDISRYSVVEGKLNSVEIITDDVFTNNFFNDQFDNIWISTDSNGLCRINGLHNLYKFSRSKAIGSVHCIAEIPEGILIGGKGGLMLPNGHVTLNGMNTWDCHVDNSGKIWSATDRGLYCIVNPKFNIPYKHEQSLVFSSPCRCLITYENKLYVGSIRGLSCNETSGPKEVLTASGKSIGYIYSLNKSANGALFIATLGNGLWVLRDGNLYQFISGGISEKCSVYCFANGPSGEIYVGHGNKISCITTGGKIRLLTETNDIIAAWSLNYLKSGELIAGTSSGMVFYDTETGHQTHRLIGPESHTPLEFTTSRSILVQDDQTILCGTSSGVYAINYSAVTKINSHPVPTCKSVKWSGATPKTVNGEIRVPYGKWYLYIKMKTCWYVDETECKMRVWLHGFDEEWSPFRTIADLHYTSLPPGHYSLEVQLSSPLAGIGPAKKIFTFHVD